MKLRLLATLALAVALLVPDIGGQISVLGPPKPVRSQEPFTTAIRPAPENFNFEAPEDDLASRASVQPQGWELTKGDAKPEFDSARGETYAALKTNDATLVSSEFSLTSKAPSVSFLYRFTGKAEDTKTNGLRVVVLSGPGYTTETEVFVKADPEATDWTEAYLDTAKWAGQNIKLKFVRGVDSAGEVAIDNIGANLMEALQGARQKSIRVADPINTTTGNFTITDTDLALSGLFSFALSRTYNSDSSYTGYFGKGWTSLLDSAVTSGGDFRYPDGSLGLHQGDALDTSDPTKRILTTRDQTAITVDNRQPRFGSFGFRSVSTDFGSLSLIQLDTGAHLNIDWIGDEYFLYVTYSDGYVEWDVDCDDPENGYDCETTRYGADYYWADGGAVEEITYGSVTWDGSPNPANDYYEVLTGTAGTWVITRDVNNWVTKIQGTGGTVNYTYNGNGELTSAAGPFGTLTYSYSSGRMTSGTDQMSHTRFTNVYTSSGHVKKQTDGVGNVHCFYYTADYETTTGCSGVSPQPSNSKNVVVDPRGKKTTYKYDNDFRTTYVDDHLANRVSYEYDADSNVTCVTNQLGKKTAFSYDNDGNMTESIDANNTDSNCDLKSGGVKSTFAYTSSNKLDLFTDPLGRKVDNIYSSGKLTEVQLKDASNNIEARTCISYVSGTHKVSQSTVSTTLSNCTGNTTKFEYSGNQMNAVIDPRFSGAGTPKTTFTYNTNGQVLTETNELGHTSTFTYNSLGQVLTAKNHLNHTTTYTYDAKGRMTTMTDALGNVTTYAYDNANRLTSVTDALSGVTSYAYDGNGNMTSVTNARSKTTSYTYDDLNRLATVTDPDSNVTSFTYDAAGNLFQRTDARGLVTKYFYDFANQLTSIEHWDGTLQDTTSYTYNAVGKRTQVVDTSGTMTYAYDDLDRLTSVTFPGSKTVSYTYNNVGQRTRITYPDSKYADYAYDAAGNLTSVTDWLGKVTSYTYNNAGALTQTTLPSSTGVTTHYTYDNADRLTKVENKQNGSTVLSSFEYTLNAVGNRTAVTTPDESNKFTYDALHRLTGACYGDCPTEAGLASDDFESQGWSGGSGWSGSWSRTGDTSIQDTSGDDYARLRATGTIVRTVDVTGVTGARLEFNSRHGSFESTDAGKVQVSHNGTTWTTVHTVSDGLDDGQWRPYDYDITSALNGNTLYVRFLGEMSSTDDQWGVDDVIVVNTSAGGTYTEDAYTYDAVGNRTAKNSITYAYGNSDQLSSVTNGGTTNYTYDDNLNQVTRGSDTFTWDHENRLIATYLGSSTYTYNSDGLRVSRTSNSVTTDYVWDVNRSIPVILQDGTNTYVYGLGLVSTTDGSGNQAYRMTDGLGSTVGLCDGSGNMIATYVYDAFGIIRSQTGSSDNYFLFTGEQRDDESGYDYLRARYYDSEVGRFLGQDAAAPIWSVPVSLNRFTYALNNPMVLVDPSGMVSTCNSLFCSDADGYVYAVLLDPLSVMACHGGIEVCVYGSGLWVDKYGSGNVVGYSACYRYSGFDCLGAVKCQYPGCEWGEDRTLVSRYCELYCPPTLAPKYVGRTPSEDSWEPGMISVSTRPSDISSLRAGYHCGSTNISRANFGCGSFYNALSMTGNDRNANWVDVGGLEDRSPDWPVGY